MNRTINVISSAGLSTSLRAHLASVLEGHAGATSAPVSLARGYSRSHGIVSTDQTIGAVYSTSEGGVLQIDLCHEDQDMKDRCGGAAFSIFGAEQLFKDVRMAIQNRPWFQDWVVYHLPTMVVVTSPSPIYALSELREGYGEQDQETVSDKVLNGVFAVLVNEDISNHEMLPISREAASFVQKLIRADQISTARLLSSTPQSDRAKRYRHTLAALDQITIQVQIRSEQSA